MKPWRDEIQRHIQDWSKRLGNLGWWPKYVYHFTDIQNAARILTDGVIYCRTEARRRGRMAVDNASPGVIAQTKSEHTRFVRLYFRPKTPTQYRNEGIRPITKRELDGAHCPVPVYFCFDALAILSHDAAEYSSGNMGSSRATHSGEREFFFQIPFAQVFHNRWFSPDEHDEIIFRRNAEVLIPHQLSLEPNLRFIACRSVAERQTLLHLLDWSVHEKWESKVKLGEQGFFERKWSYVEEVVVVDQDVIFRFNPNTQTPGPFNVKVEYREHNTQPSITWKQTFEQLSGTLRVRPPNAAWGEIRLYLDDALAFSDTITFEEIPF